MRRRLRAGAAGEGTLVYGAGILDSLGAESARAVRPGPCLLVTDRTVDRLHGGRARASLRRSGFGGATLVLAPGERSKNLAGAAAALQALARQGADRSTPVVALGGGVVTDLAGFAAAVYARGIPWIAVPTTLLGMADAAVGGKTGVDLPEGKNLAGAFHLPRLVFADAALLSTLPRRHLRNGLAEVAKMELLAGVRRALPRLARLAVAARTADPALLAPAVARAAAAKASLVERDPLERADLRILLNLGHTVGHALEAATGYGAGFLHGEAVAVGIVVAARVAEGRGLLRAGEPLLVEQSLRALGLPTVLPAEISRREILERTGVDKKRRAGSLRMVLPRSAAGAVVAEVSRAELKEALR